MVLGGKACFHEPERPQRFVSCSKYCEHNSELLGRFGTSIAFVQGDDRTSPTPRRHAYIPFTQTNPLQ